MKYTDEQNEAIDKLNKFHIAHSRKDQILKSIEEFSSLIKLWSKLLLSEIPYEDINLLDELFDADVMMRQLKKILVPDEYVAVLYNNVVNAKLERELKRIIVPDTYINTLFNNVVNAKLERELKRWDLDD